MIKTSGAKFALGCAAILALGACSAETAQTSDFDPAEPTERVVSTRQALSTCVDVQRGLNGTVEDTFISSAAPGTNNGGYVSVYSGLDNGAEKRTLLKFDLSFLPANATIDSAR